MGGGSSIRLHDLCAPCLRAETEQVELTPAQAQSAPSWFDSRVS